MPASCVGGDMIAVVLLILEPTSQYGDMENNNAVITVKKQSNK